MSSSSEIEMIARIALSTVPLWFPIFLIIFLNQPVRLFFFLTPKYRKLKADIPGILYRNSEYYRNLSDSEKERFEKRVFEFIAYKKFHKMGDFEISDEMKVLIATTATQITFGFSREYDYKAFKSIVISQKDYLSMLTHKQHKGETKHG